MSEDSQLFNLAIPAPVLDGRPPFVEPPRKYCTQGLRVPLQMMGKFNATAFRISQKRKWYPPHHALNQWSEHLVPGRYPDNLPPFDMQLLTLETHDASVFLTLIRGGCREANVGSDFLEVRLFEAEVETKRRFGYVLWERPARLVVFGVR